MTADRAVFSPCRSYRYALYRDLGPEPLTVAFIGLNPSTADEATDDPTIRRCMAFAKAWRAGRLVMLNLFAFRATDPRVMKRVADPVGPDNDEWIKCETAGCGVTVAAWGRVGSFMRRDEVVRDILPHLSYLRLNRDSSPTHPLYLPSNLTPQPWPGMERQR